MADPLGVAGSIVGIVAMGLKLGTTLQAYVETAVDSEDSIRDIAFEISATASALQQLLDLIKPSEPEAQGGRPPILNEAGLREILSVAKKCRGVYEKIFELIVKATRPAAFKGKGGETATGEIDLDSLTIQSLYQKMRWPWLEPRVKKQQEQLRGLKIDLIFHLSVVQLAQLKIQWDPPLIDYETVQRLTHIL